MKLTFSQIEELECAKRACNQPKSRLIDVIRHMESHGLDEKAEELGRIIAELEAWQAS